MDIEQHKENLKKYIEEDMAFREPLLLISDFDRYCYNHCKDIEAVLAEINKLNNVIDRMAKKLSQVPMYHFKSKSNIYSSDNIDLVAMSVDEIKDYFMDMKEDK